MVHGYRGRHCRSKWGGHGGRWGVYQGHRRVEGAIDHRQGARFVPDLEGILTSVGYFYYFFNVSGVSGMGRRGSSHSWGLRHSSGRRRRQVVSSNGHPRHGRPSRDVRAGGNRFGSGGDGSTWGSSSFDFLAVFGLAGSEGREGPRYFL